MTNAPTVLECEYEINDYSPEKKLLNAILIRALADLSPHVDLLVKRRAIKWFLGTDYCKDDDRDHFSYKDICEALDLSSSRRSKISEMVEESRASLINRLVLVTQKGNGFRKRHLGHTYVTHNYRTQAEA